MHLFLEKATESHDMLLPQGTALKITPGSNVVSRWRDAYKLQLQIE